MKCQVCGKDINHIRAVVVDPDGVSRHSSCNRTAKIIRVEGEVIARPISEKKESDKAAFTTFSEEINSKPKKFPRWGESGLKNIKSGEDYEPKKDDREKS